MKNLYCVVRVELEQKTEPNGSYSLPISFVDVITYVTKWETQKDKTYRKLRQLMQDAKASRKKYPRFGVATQTAEAMATASTANVVAPLVDKRET